MTQDTLDAAGSAATPLRGASEPADLDPVPELTGTQKRQPWALTPWTSPPS